MGQIIHTKETPHGIRFRLWSTNSDGYLTDEMTEMDMREHILKLVVCQAIETHNREIDARIQRAVNNGTSSMIGHTRDPKKDWEKSRNL